MSYKGDQTVVNKCTVMYGSHNACHVIVRRIEVKAGALTIPSSVLYQVNRTI